MPENDLNSSFFSMIANSWIKITQGIHCLLINVLVLPLLSLSEKLWLFVVSVVKLK